MYSPVGKALKIMLIIAAICAVGVFLIIPADSLEPGLVYGAF